MNANVYPSLVSNILLDEEPSQCTTPSIFIPNNVSNKLKHKTLEKRKVQKRNLIIIFRCESNFVFGTYFNIGTGQALNEL